MEMNYMNQMCKVCGEPAAGFHFGAFTCEGCKSFFGRSYNNLSSISECKNNGECIINKKNRTSCKACRLRKCVMVGMSKSGSRYGRRSNWFKIHCLLQERNAHVTMDNLVGMNKPPEKAPQQPPPHMGMGLLGVPPPFPPPMLHIPKTREELMLLGFEDYNKSSATHPVSVSPESHNSDTSVEISDARRLPIYPSLLQPTLLPPPGLLFTHGYPLYPSLLQHANNNNGLTRNHNLRVEEPQLRRRIFLDAILQSQRTPTPEEVERQVPAASPVQSDPMDLSMKAISERGSSPAQSDRSGSVDRGNASEDTASDSEMDEPLKPLPRPIPLDLTTKV